MSESHAPLTAAMFNVLITLADGEKHGYAILKEVEEQTAGEVQLSHRNALWNHQAAAGRWPDCGITPPPRGRR